MTPTLPGLTQAAAPETAFEIARRIRQTARLRVRSIRPRGDARPLAERIADAMREMAFAGQTVTRESLSLRGFTLAEMTDAVLAQARDLATAASIRRIGA